MLRTRLLCTTLLVSAAIAGPVLAQPAAAPPPTSPPTATTPAPADATPPAKDSTTADATVAPLIITGTRLQVQDYITPNPTVTATSQQIEMSGDTSLGDFLTDYPALVSSITDQVGADTSTPFYVGLNLLDLRNLGADRTLVLVNGRRHVAAFPGTSAVDVNTIPTDLVDRVEILTGGTSAVYGADGVSGVVNFILKDNFQGVTGRTEFGTSQEGGGTTEFASLLAGHNYRNDTANLVFAAEYNFRQDVKFTDRRYTRPGIRKTLFDNPAEAADQTSDDPNIPDQILVSNLRYYDSSPGSSLYTRYTDAAPRFLGNGDPFIHGVNLGGFISIGGSGTLLDQYNDDLLPGVARWAVNLNGHWDVSNKTRLFEELKYTQSNASFTAQPSYDYGLLIPTDNPYIPASAVHDAETNPDGFGDFVLVARDNFDLGRTVYNNTRTSQRGVFGVDSRLSDAIDFEGSFVYGRAMEKVHSTNVRINERYYAATDAVDDGSGHIVCRSNLDPSAIPTGDVFAQFGFDPSTWGTTFTPGPNSGCVPANIFGQGHISQAARDWINTDVTDRSTIDQTVLNGYITGDTRNWFHLPAGSVSFVLGAEYRRETSDFEPDAIEILADQLGYPLTGAGRASVTRGAFHVTEGFSELSVPLIKDKPWFKALTVQGAYRYSDYSLSGPTDTWNIAGRWQLNDSLMFRATRARAVRAPNISDLFQGRQQTFETLVDPCSHENLASTDHASTRLANCTTDLAPLGYTVGPTTSDYTDNSSEATGGFISGNTALKPEKADTQTIGVVFTPTKIPGLSMSLDWYKVRITDAITAYSAQTIVDKCYDEPRPNPFCALITRQGLGDPFPGRISGFDQIPGNIASFETSGTDFTIRYLLDPARFGAKKDYGKFDISLVGNVLDRLAFVEESTGSPSLSDGDSYAPTFQATLDVDWTFKNWDVDYGLGYFDPTRRVGRVTRVVNPDIMASKYYDYAARVEHDIRVAYTYKKNTEVFGGINNFTNQKPEFQDYTYPVSPLGRFFYLGVRVKH